jgi:isoamylase
VVYNHTAEGNERGPTLSFKGIDNASYYRLLPTRSATTSTTPAPATRSICRTPRDQMVTDSLRYWVSELHVDGFRFDLGTILAREQNGFDNQSGFLKACIRTRCCDRQADRRTLGLRTRRLPGRRLPAGLGGMERSLSRYGAGLLAGEARPANWRRASAPPAMCSIDWAAPWACVNFITAHDGFTLNDLVTYNDKHNEANGEDNRDGSSDNRSWNCGAEGPTDDPGHQRAARAPDPQHAGHAAALAGHADAAGRRRVRPHAGRQQQRLLPGQRHQLGQLGFEAYP